MASTAKSVYDAHESEYKQSPKVIISTPGRFHLLGEHSWFFRDKTLSMGINIPVFVAVSFRDDNQVHFNYVQLNDRKKASLSSIKIKKEDRWANALKAVLYGYVSGGFQLKGMDFTVYSEILPSAGFGITTAIKVGAAFAIRHVMKFNMTDGELLQVVERGNRLFLKTGNYIADNYAALYSEPGSVILTDHAKGTYEKLPFNFPERKVLLTDASVPRISTWDEEMVQEPEYALLLGDLRIRKPNVFGGWFYENSDTEINEILSGTPEEHRRKLLYIIQEHDNVLEAVEALEKGDFYQIARAVNKSHSWLRDFYDISCPEIEWILKRLGELDKVQNAREPYSCGRLTGKGFGRCIYAMIAPEAIDTYKEKLSEYERIFGFQAFTYEVKPSKGAHIVRP